MGLGHSPRAHHPVNLETHVEVMCRGKVLLHDKHACADAADGKLLVALDLRPLQRSPLAHRRHPDRHAGKQ